ncbi:unnamed protein product [Ilex paraguariensis]|uniref:Uncharacterized protein n=1 Tax=Ilex paraguariensis TaxID=185542 RepID=A0ABC8U8Y9_9AQUA
MNHNFTNDPIFPNDSHHDVFSEEEALRDCDYFDEVLKYINQMQMEEDDLENKPCMFQDYSALHATEKSFHDVLGQNYLLQPPFKQYSSFLDQNANNPNGNFTRTFTSCHSSTSFIVVSTFVKPNWIIDQCVVEPGFGQSSLLDHNFQSNLQSSCSSNNFCDVVDG